MNDSNEFKGKSESDLMSSINGFAVGSKGLWLVKVKLSEKKILLKYALSKTGDVDAVVYASETLDAEEKESSKLVCVAGVDRDELGESGW